MAVNSRIQQEFIEVKQCDKTELLKEMLEKEMEKAMAADCELKFSLILKHPNV